MLEVKNHIKGLKRELREKSTSPCRGPRFSSYTYKLVPTPSSGLWALGIHALHIHTCNRNTHKQNRFKKQNKHTQYALNFSLVWSQLVHGVKSQALYLEKSTYRSTLLLNSFLGNLLSSVNIGNTSILEFLNYVLLRNDT